MIEKQSKYFPRGFSTAKRTSWVDDGDKTNPGPGTHQGHRADKPQPPSYRIGNATNRQGFLHLHNKNNPSPLHYSPNPQAIKKKSPSAIIPLATIDNKSNEIPSTHYSPNHQHIKTKYPHFSFGYSIDRDYSTLVPGVGEYHHSRETKSMNKTQEGFSSSLRPQPYGECVKFPGPGKYLTIDSQKGVEYSFPRGQRATAKINPKQPLATFYDLGPKMKAIKSNKFFESTEYHRHITIEGAIENPAPNAYHNQLPKGNHCITIQKSNRRPLQNIAVVDFPSPDKYSQVVEKHLEGLMKKGITFTHQLRKLSITQKLVPGPGTYELMKTFSKVGGGAIDKQIPIQSKFIVPAANNYSPSDEQIRKKVHSTIVLKSDRVDFSRTVTGGIGPGSYLPAVMTAAESQLGIIGKSSRKQLTPSNKNPGVGNYNIPGYFGRLPNYYRHSPRKVNESGYSTFHQKLKSKAKQMQKLARQELVNQSEGGNRNQNQKTPSSQSQIKN